MNHIIKFSLLSFVLMVSPVEATRTDATHNIAEKVVDLMNDNVHFNYLVESEVDSQITRNPDLKPYREVIVKFLNKYCGYDEIKGELVHLYSQEFSKEELLEIAKFYHSPTGKKCLEKIPKLSSAASDIGYEKALTHQDELENMIQEKEQEMLFKGGF